MKASSFAPIARDDARILILGSMPGVESLRRQQYYAHPQNSFWKLIAEILGFEYTPDYRKRTAALIRNRVALWDVLKFCERPGSLDSSIHVTSEVPNDFADVFARHPAIRAVFFNGSKAAASYRRLVLPHLKELELRYQALPSTSPAHAALNFAAKKRVWQKIKTELNQVSE